MIVFLKVDNIFAGRLKRLIFI